MAEYRLKRITLPPTFTLSLYDGSEPLKVERIGKGAFCTAYRLCESQQTSREAAERVYLVVKDEDASKEILSGCESPHIPQLERVGSIGDAYLWQTRYYSPLTASSREAWKTFKMLAACNEDARRKFYAVRGNHWGAEANRATVELAKAEGIETPLLEALHLLTEQAAQYGESYTFEFARRNLAVDREGRLILLDPLFDLEAISRRNDAARKRRERY